MPLYEISTKGEDAKRLVQADSAAQAVRHCAQGMFAARTVSKPTDIAQLMSNGVKLETAGEEPPEAQGD